MNKIIKPLGDVKEHPFDIFVAIVLFLLGTYAFVDGCFPESVSGGPSWLIDIVCAYFMVSSLLIIISSCKFCMKSTPVFSIVGQVYGWGFISAAALATSISYLSVFFHGGADNWISWGIWLVIWLGLSIISLNKSLSIYKFYKGENK